MSKVKFEFSAGGVVLQKNNVLLIKTKDLKGNVVITFPKGNIKRSEKPSEAALREVYEETGYQCEIVKEINRVTYFYRKNNQLIRKTVYWYQMKPLKKIKDKDWEVLDVIWEDINKLSEILTYKSDKKLIETISK